MPLSPAPTFCSQMSTSPNLNMPFSWKKLARKKESKQSFSSTTSSLSSRAPSTTPSSYHRMTNPFAITTPTRRPSRLTETAPPAYSASGSSAVQTTEDSPYAFLAEFDTIFLIDDSGSMAGRNWRETSAALSAITPICTAYDADGIDVYFLNHRNSQELSGGYLNITTPLGVDGVFNSVRPLGPTPLGGRLFQILKPYLARVEAATRAQAAGEDVKVRPLNIIAVTDGVASDDVESVIVQAAKRLDSWGAEPWQLGIQLFQVGEEPEAAEALRELDDSISGQHNIRDIVDTVPWIGESGGVLNAEHLLKITLGSVTRRLDRKSLPRR